MLVAIIVVIGLSLLVFGHEAGHFVAAKLFKLRVDEFGFGFPPRLFGIRRYRGTKRVPVGIEKETVDIVQKEEGTAVAEEKIISEREIDLIVPVKKWSFFWGKEPAGGVEGLTADTTIYSINWLPFGGFVRIAGENDRADKSNERVFAAIPEEEKRNYFIFQPAWRRSVVLLAGVFINLVFGWLLLSSVYLVGIAPAVVVGDVRADSPAAAAGVKQGDVIKNFTNANAFIQYVNENRGKEIVLSVLRDGNTISLKVTPRANPAPGEGALGVNIAESGITRVGFFRAFWEGLKDTWSIMTLTVVGLGMLIKNLVTQHALIEGVVGPVGIFSVAEQAGQLGLIYIVRLLSLISINLAVINLIPFPALDGGRFLMVLIEKVKGSPVPVKVEMWINAAGFALLILLMAFITFHDIARLL